MCVCVCIYIYIYIYIYVCVCMYRYVCVGVCVGVCVTLYKKGAKRDALLRQQKTMEEEAKFAEKRAEA